PLADVGYTLLYWGAGEGKPVVHVSQACADGPGFFTTDELVSHYAAVSGRKVDHVTFYVVLAAFKLSIIGAGNIARHRAAGEELANPSSISPLGEWALGLWRAEHPG